MVGLDILGIQIPPVTQGKAIEHGLGNRHLPPSCQGGFGVGGDDYLAQGKEGFGHGERLQRGMTAKYYSSRWQIRSWYCRLFAT